MPFTRHPMADIRTKAQALNDPVVTDMAKEIKLSRDTITDEDGTVNFPMRKNKGKNMVIGIKPIDVNVPRLDGNGDPVLDEDDQPISDIVSIFVIRTHRFVYSKVLDIFIAVDNPDAAITGGQEAIDKFGYLTFKEADTQAQILYTTRYGGVIS